VAKFLSQDIERGTQINPYSDYCSLIQPHKWALFVYTDRCIRLNFTCLHIRVMFAGAAPPSSDD